MLNRKYYPFERNSYYYGKLLTAKDFAAEQKYFNDKRRLTNRLGGANGIVSGLGVIRADDASVILQAGCAYDASGREIIVPETQVIKLSTIEGFSELKSDSVYLGISYAEKPSDKVYAVMASADGGEERYNKVREEFKLTLLDEALAAPVRRPLDDFVQRQVIYADADVELVQFVPRFLPRTKGIRIRTEFRKKSAGTGKYSFCYDLAVPNFVTLQGEKELSIGMNNLKLSCGESKTFCCTLKPEEYIWGAGGSVAMTVSELILQKDGETLRLNDKMDIQIKPVAKDLESFCISEYYSKAMDETLEHSYDESLWIAKLELIRNDDQVMIDQVLPPPYEQYSYNPQQLMLLHRLQSYYPAVHEADRETEQLLPEAQLSPEPPAGMRNTACGVFELGIGLDSDQKQEIFSTEIMHGLGKGPVYVELGVEYVNAADPGEENSEIILGDGSIFENDPEKPADGRVYDVKTAVKVLPERGTFVIGVRLGKTTDLISLRIRWYAFRLNEINKQLEAKHEGSGYILVNPDTIVVPPKGTVHLSPVFINMPAEACAYRMEDAEGGTVDQNGVYTAPAKEGVYEIRIEALSNPEIYAHAFAIVSQKKKEDDS